jgi:ectoine hydroxylase-related dioxygenase (phytanoyl-CoA dioxygenase family)
VTETVADLSAIHGPVGSLFQGPAGRAGWDRYRLSDEQVAFFHENGYLAGPRVLQDEQAEVLRGELAGLASPDCPGRPLFYEYNSNESADPSKVLFHALGAWRVAAGFHDLLWHPAVVVPMAQLLGGPIRLWHDQLFYKPARHGGVVAWHQDYSYWTMTEPVGHLTCWIALDDATLENGCLHYVPGSHRWDLLPITGLAGDMNAIRQVLGPEQAEQFRPVAIPLPTGHCSFHHPLTVHGSYANTAGNPRRATVVNVFRDGTRSASDETALEGVPAIPRGQPMAGRFYPVLFDPAEVPA